ERGTFEEQQAHAKETCEGIGTVLQKGYRVVVTHGNGPQVGEALLRSERANGAGGPQHLDVCGAETEGAMGYLLQQTLDNTLYEKGMPQKVVSLITQVIVDADDPAFLRPDKPIGPCYRKDEAEQRRDQFGWKVVEDAGRGWRRVVASPHPRRIYEIEAIRACLDAGFVVIAAGGGGIPVVRRAGRLRGSEAVIDKDRCSALLARDLEAERPLFHVSWEKALEYLTHGEFPAGSMGPKVEAALAYLEAGGKRALITAPESIELALGGSEGTEILPPAGVVDEQVAVR